MPMFKKNLKLIATAIGLVAVLVMGLAMPGATQSSFSRQTLINALNNEINILTASVGDPLNLEATAFFSFARATSAYIPPHPSSWSAQLFKDFVRGKVEAISLGAIYVAEDITGVIAKGLYRIKTLNRETAILIDQNGNTVLTRRIRWSESPETIAANPLFEIGDVTIAAGSSSYVLSMPTPGGSEGGGVPPPPVPMPPGPGGGGLPPVSPGPLNPPAGGISITVTIRIGQCFGGYGVLLCIGAGEASIHF
jgi:hypothetical protein